MGGRDQGAAVPPQLVEGGLFLLALRPANGFVQNDDLGFHRQDSGDTVAFLRGNPGLSR